MTEHRAANSDLFSHMTWSYPKAFTSWWRRSRPLAASASLTLRRSRASFAWDLHRLDPFALVQFRPRSVRRTSPRRVRSAAGSLRLPRSLTTKKKAFGLLGLKHVRAACCSAFASGSPIAGPASEKATWQLASSLGGLFWWRRRVIKRRLTIAITCF